MPIKSDIIINLQKKYKNGGFALVTKSGKLSAFGNDIRLLYEKIDKDNIDDSDKIVMYVPSPKHIHVFIQFSV